MEMSTNYPGMFLEAIIKIEAQIIVIVKLVADSEFFRESGVEEVNTESPLSNKESLRSFLVFVQELGARNPTSEILGQLQSECINLNRMSQALDLHIFLGAYRKHHALSELYIDVLNVRSLKIFAKWTRLSNYAGLILRAAFLAKQRGVLISTCVHMTKDIIDDKVYPPLSNFVDIFEKYHLQVSMTTFKFGFAFSFINFAAFIGRWRRFLQKIPDDVSNVGIRKCTIRKCSIAIAVIAKKIDAAFTWPIPWDST